MCMHVDINDVFVYAGGCCSGYSNVHVPKHIFSVDLLLMTTCILYVRIHACIYMYMQLSIVI